MKPGPAPSYKNPDKLRQAIDEYAKERIANDQFPTHAGLLLYLRISRAYEQELLQIPELRAEFERAELIREDWLAQNMAKDNKRAAGCMNNLKQPINGGYADKSSDNAPQELKINFAGVGGADAFK